MTLANVTFDSFFDDVLKQNIDVSSDTFYAMLVANAYTPDRGGHTKRSDVTNEISGTGYAAGGVAVVATIAKDTSGHKNTISFGNAVWSSSTLTARGPVVYKHRGGLASADELVLAGTFGADVSSSSSTFTAVNTAPITLNL